MTDQSFENSQYGNSPTNAMQHVTYDGSPKPRETSIQDPDLDPNAIVRGMPTNLFKDQTVHEAQVDEARKQNYGDALRMQMMEKEKKK